MYRFILKIIQYATMDQLVDVQVYSHDYSTVSVSPKYMK